jgi:mono/diheme cytochrome c family protein
MKTLGALLAIAVAAGAAGLAFVYSGRADVAATSPHWAVTEWVLSTAMQRSVERHARGIELPGSLDDAARVRAGAEAYDAMCVGCHGAPGVEPGPVGEGLEPEPPELAHEAEDWSPAELFWVTKHGVRMTGMPAFGPTHSDRDLWDLVAFVQRLPRLSAAEYQSLAGRNVTAPRSPEGHAGHAHHHPGSE